MKITGKQILSMLLALVLIGGVLPLGRIAAQAETGFNTAPMLAEGMILKSDGTVWTWGDNIWGSASVNHRTPVQVESLNYIVAIASRPGYFLALKNDGTVWVWGWRCPGQQNDVFAYERLIPVQVQNLNGIIAIAAGNYHSLALKNDGTVWAWGANTYGQLGDNSTTERNVPVQAANLEGISAIAAGDGHSLALKSDGTVWAWGLNQYGQLGDNTTIITRRTAEQVQSLSNVAAIAAGGHHNLALKHDGSVWAWGSNSSGQLGNNTTTGNSGYNLPVQTHNLNSVIAIVAGDSHSYALKSDGTVWAWGAYVGGFFGDSPATNRILPVQIPTLSGITAISTDLALKNDGSVWALGSCWDGLLDYNISQVSLHSIMNAIAAGGMHSLAVKNDKTVWAWGANSYGQLGDSTTTDQKTLVQVKNLSDVTAISASNHSLALKNDGTVWAWGSNYIGQLGDNTTIDRNIPVQVEGLNNTTAIATGGAHSLALRNDGTIWAWGLNDNGQLGDGTTAYRLTPVQVQALGDVIAIAASGNNSLALKNDGTVWAWGINWHGQLGDGTINDSTIPVQVKNLSGVISVAAGGDHNLALKNDGTVWAWGYNGYGQLGDNSTATRSTPIQVHNLNSVDAIAGGSNCSFALKSDGTVWAWGWNGYGQFGIYYNVGYTTPVQTHISGVTDLAAGGGHTLAIRNDGMVMAWGWNGNGQLGDGTAANRSTPVQIMEPENDRYFKAYDTAPTYTIILNPSGGSVSPTSIPVTYGGTFSLLPTPTHATSTFSGWYTEANGGRKVNPTDIVQLNANITLYAHWAATAYAVTVVNGTGSGNYAAGAIVSISANAAPNGKTFDRWTTTAGVTINPNSANAAFIMPASAITVTATYKNTPFVTVPMLAAGGLHVLALKSDGTVWAWGDNMFGQLGGGSVANTIPTLRDVIAIAAGGDTSLALKSDGTVWAWGYNGNGQLGDNTTTNRNTPVQVQNLSNVIAIAAGGNHNLALKNDGTVWAWGLNDNGQLGNGTTTSSRIPVQVQNLSNVTAIATGGSGSGHSLAVKSDGTVWAWGWNSLSQLGDNSITRSLTPVQVQTQFGNYNGIKIDVAAGEAHSIALKDDGTAWAWGANSVGQLGINSTDIARHTPGQAMMDATAIAAGMSHSLALKNDGTVWAWGHNYYGQLGDKTKTNRLARVQVQDISGVTAIAAGGHQSLALKSDGTIWMWGWNNNNPIAPITAPIKMGADWFNVYNSTFIVNLNPNGGNVTPSSFTVSYGDTYSALPTPRRSDYSFDGWYTAISGGEKVNPTDIVDLTGNITLYARWTAIAPATYTLTVVNGSGTGSYTAEATVTITANAAPSGKVFDKWTATAGILANATSATTTFTMPAGVATVTATYKDAPPTTYALTVVSGSGTGNYTAGETVTITANAAPSGKVFDKWAATAGSLANANNATTTFTMPAGAATVTATYKDAPSSTYALTVVNGSGTGSYATGETVPITASAAPSGKVFDKWIATAGTLANANNASTTFTMPAGAATVTATYMDIPTTTYTLTVVSGSGTGNYIAGATIAITANTAPSGKIFDKWIASAGTLANANSESTTFTMPAGVATVTATYKDAPPAPANKSALNSRINEIGGTQRGKYTADSWNIFQSALNTARSIANDANATQSQVDNALGNLNTAYANLKTVATIFSTGYEATTLNWILFIVCFGWIWMWF